MSDYLKTLETSLEKQGFRGQVLIVQSNEVSDEPRKSKNSCLCEQHYLDQKAAGVIMYYIGMVAGRPNIISCDMGGTSFDVSLIVNGESSLLLKVLLVLEWSLEHPWLK